MKFSNIRSEETKKIDDQLQIVVLRSPYDTIHNPLTQILLPKIAALKIAAYSKAYPYGIMPVDTIDFIGTHLVLCLRTGPSDLDLTPIMAMKSISMKKCKAHGVRFPLLTMLEGEEFAPYRRAVDLMIEQNQGSDVGYNGSWTMADWVKAHPVLRQACYEVTTIFLIKLYGSMSEFEMPLGFGAATLRFKVELIKEFCGFEFLEDEKKILPPMPCRSFYNEMVALMGIRKAARGAIELSQSYASLWEKKILIQNNVSSTPALRRVAS